VKREAVLALILVLTPSVAAQARPNRPSPAAASAHRESGSRSSLAKPLVNPRAKRAVVRGASRNASSAPAFGSEDALPPVDRRDAIGSISVGHPHAGFLLNPVRMPKGKQWVISVPQHAYGTEETIRGLIRAIHRVHELFPGSPPVFIGSISPEGGGPAPPHVSHRTGRDVDVYFYRTPGARWYTPATADDLDRARTWALLKAFLTLTEVEFVLIDRSVQDLLEPYALSIGEDPRWIAEVFHGDGTIQSNLVKHVPGHREHMHVRFVSPIARERGRAAYDRLVLQGHIERPIREVRITVARGDTLAAIADTHHTSIEAIRERNQLAGVTIQPGQVIVIDEQTELRGAHDPVVVPQRQLPSAARSEVAATGGSTPLDELERAVTRALQDAQPTE
jgi:hypothetical protein